MPLIRLDMLSRERLIELSTQSGDLIRGMEQKVIAALCAKLNGAATIDPSLRSQDGNPAVLSNQSLSPDRVSVRS